MYRGHGGRRSPLARHTYRFGSSFRTARNSSIASLSPAVFVRFVDSLRRCGLLEAQSPGQAPQAARKRRVRGRLLYLRLKAFDPDRLFDRLLPYVRWFFTPGYVALSAAAILLDLSIVAGNWHEIQQGILHLYRFDALFVIWLTIL